MNILSRTSRLNQILIVVLVVQIALAAFVLRPRAAASESGTLLPGFKASEVTAVTISDGQGKSVNLAKKGDDWVLSSVVFGNNQSIGLRVLHCVDVVPVVQSFLG